MSRPTAAPPLTTRPRLFPRLRRPVVVRAPAGRVSSARARARRSLAWGALAFALTTAVLSATIETALPQVRDPEYGYRLVRLRAQQRAHPDRPLVVVLGTSRTQNAIDPLAMPFPDEPGAPLVFNFGRSGIRPLHLRFTLQRLHADGVRPNAVLVEVFPVFLQMRGPADPAFRDTAAQLTAADVERLAPHLADPGALRRRWLLARIDPWSAYRSDLLARAAPAAVPWGRRIDHQWTMMDQHGFNAYPPEVVTEEKRVLKRANMHRTFADVLEDLQVSAESDAAYRELVADCRAAGVPVAFFFAPESPVFQSWYAPESRAAVDAFVRMLTAELGCPVFGAPTDFAEEDFADGHHVLRPAAARYSRWLADEHLKPWLANGR